MQSLGKVSSCIASRSAGRWRSVVCVRVDVHEGGDLLIQVLNAAWHFDSKRGKKELWCTQIHYCTDTFTCLPYRDTYDSSMKEIYCHIVSTGFMLCYPANHSFGNAWDRNSSWLVVAGFMAQHCTTVLCGGDLSHGDWPNQSPKQHSFEVSLTSRQQTVLLWANYNNTPQPIVHSLTAQIHEEKTPRPWARFASGPICKESDWGCNCKQLHTPMLFLRCGHSSLFLWVCGTMGQLCFRMIK